MHVCVIRGEKRQRGRLAQAGRIRQDDTFFSRTFALIDLLGKSTFTLRNVSPQAAAHAHT